MEIVKHKIGEIRIYQLQKDTNGGLISVDDVVASWNDSFLYNNDENNGFRPAQRGALFAIKSHWVVSKEPATVVMPTGTGKTETMIATIVSELVGRTFIIVPSNMLRKQTAERFISFGVLKKIGVIKEGAYNPVVAVMNKTPQNATELKEILDKSNVTVTTMALLQRFSEDYLEVIAQCCDTLIVDEAHHIAANTWSTAKYKLRKLRCLQFTATPFRNDGKKIDGKIIFNFPLSLAQEQGYFKPISFMPIWEFDEEKGDIAIATAAIRQLEVDLESGFDHTILVRAKDKKSADRLYNDIYKSNFEEYSPVLIHSGIPASDRVIAMEAVKNKTSRVVVCVDMFGEGIDVPSLKIAAIHDKYKSLPITLQFIGRFARSSDGLGDAKVITNIANDELNESLRELYSQDSDWNTMLHVISSHEINKELSLQHLAEGFDMSALQGISIQQLRPKVSMVAYKTNDKRWKLENIYRIFDPEKCFFTVNEENKVLVIVEKLDTKIEWTSFKGFNDTNWNLHLVYWNIEKKMFYVNSTSKSISDTLAGSFFEKSERIRGEKVFRCLHGIKRLMLGTVGLKSAIDGPIRYKMFAGIDIADGISESQKETSFKSNLFGVGYDGNGKISIGCSYKGRIWSKWIENIDYWMKWCDEIATRLKDERIDTSTIFEGALVPEIIKGNYDAVPYDVEWPIDMDLLNDQSMLIKHESGDFSIYETDIKLSSSNQSGPVRFKVSNENFIEEYELVITETDFSFSVIQSAGLILKKGKNEYKMAEFFKSYPPHIKFVDQASLEGNILVKILTSPAPFNTDRIEVWNWDGVDIKKESQGIQRDTSSIQYKVINEVRAADRYSVIFDDDSSGEVADVVCISDEDEKIRIHLYHCKYAHGDNPGSRVSDLYEVCGQAEKSVKWCQESVLIIDRLIKRENLRSKSGGTRFEVGNLQKLREIKNKMRFYPTDFEITIVQPGMSSKSITDDMRRILSGTATYLMDTFGVELNIICSE